ncbi:MAG TPA: ModD protein [Rhodocyclaceae bacterium]|nr:ModD protein [Rhodocyclaceae bacterium]
MGLSCLGGFGCCLDDAALLGLLRDDAPYGDLTTSSLGIGDKPGCAVFLARQSMRVCCSEEAVRLFQLVGAEAEIHRPTGAFATAGTMLLEARGPASALHLAWKVVQTLMEYASGIATTAADMVAALHQAGFSTPVACTRKHFPGTKAIAVKAVTAGGAVMHRLGLSETLLLFPEHRVLLGADPEVTLADLGARCPEKKRVVEVTSVDEALAFARAGAEVLQLEKFSVDQVARCRGALNDAELPSLLAAAGGINAANAVDYARAGADLIVTSAPYFAKPADVQVRIDAA